MAANHRQTASAVRRWRRVVVGGAPVLIGLAALDARAAQLFHEDFESLELQPFVSTSETGGDGTDWTNVPPVGWARDNGTTPDFGPPEFFGFTIMDWSSWIATEMNQERSMFTRGVGALMVSDADAYDDMGPNGVINNLPANSYNVLMTTPAISLANVQADTAVLNFDSSFRPYDQMTATVEVSFDGGENFQNLLSMNSANVPGGDSSLERVDEAISIPLNNPAGAADMLIRFGMSNADNDWWWAVDNIDVQGEIVPEPSSAGIIALGMAGLAMTRRRRRA
jgi:hypothetical protein